MRNGLIISIFVLLVFCITVVPVAAKKGGIFVGPNSEKAGKFKQDRQPNACSRNRIDDALCSDVLGKGNNCKVTGTASLITSKQSCKALKRKRSTKNRNVECDTQRQNWINDHPNNNELPDFYGKMFNYRLAKNSAEKWAGKVELCSWIGNDEYYFKLDIVANHVQHSGNDNNPFPGTLDLAGKRVLLDMIRDAGWRHKLHAKGNNFRITTAKLNGDNLTNKNAEFFQDRGEECFDIFFLNAPVDNTLPTQFGYCMGRCNAKIVNTR